LAHRCAAEHRLHITGLKRVQGNKQKPCAERGQLNVSPTDSQEFGGYVIPTADSYKMRYGHKSLNSSDP
jgi:hypothetical protein